MTKPLTCTVKPHVRRLPVKPSPFESEVNQQLMRAFALDIAERKIEREIAAHIALEVGGLR